jgi:pilus assembly protein CpaE
MARLITVSMDCRNEAARQTFEEIVSRRRDYLVTKGQGTGVVDMLLLEFDELRPQQTFSHIRGLLTASPHIEVFLTASRTDPQVLLEAFRLGVKEFLPQPLTRQEVEAAIGRFEQRFNGRVSDSEVEGGRVVSVIGVRGGVGTSTAATNLAICLQRAGHRDTTALVDLDMHGGNLGLFLDMHASQGLKHLANDISRLDETIVRSSLVKHSSGLHFLASGYDGFDEVQPTAGSTMRVLGLLRSMHRHVVVDCGHVLEPAVKEAMDASDLVLVVTTLSLPSIRRTKRLLEVLGAAQYPAGKIAVVVNRYTNDQRELLRETEDMLGIRMAGQIPNDYGTANEAIDHGKPLTVMAPKTALAQWYARRSEVLLADKAGVNGTGVGKEQNKKVWLLGRYLPSFGSEMKGKPSIV